MPFRLIASPLALIFCFIIPCSGYARLSLFTDCECDHTLLKQELNYLDHTIDPATADVNLFVVTNYLNGGGRVYNLRFKGQNELAGNELNFKVSTTPLMTDMEREAYLIKRIELGLAGMLAGTDYADLIALNTAATPETTAALGTVEEDEAPEAEEEEINPDNWNNWIFSARANFRANSESLRSRNDIRFSFNADRTTPEWRLRSRSGIFYRIDKIEQFEPGEPDEQGNPGAPRKVDPLISIRRDQWQNLSVVKSISNHWSVGLFGSWLSNTFLNYDHGIRLSPAIEYNIFDYNQVPFKELTIAYRAGWVYNDYFDTTIFLEDQEHLARQSVDMELRLRQRWGSVLAGISAGNYFKDPSLNRLEMDLEADVRLFRGLSFTVDVAYNIINDQINLAKGESSIEDVLLGQAQLATNYSSDIRFGFSYTFGAMFNNIINTRL
jgi:hypothetical protein